MMMVVVLAESTVEISIVVVVKIEVTTMVSMAMVVVAANDGSDRGGIDG